MTSAATDEEAARLLPCLLDNKRVCPRAGGCRAIFPKECPNYYRPAVSAALHARDIRIEAQDAEITRLQIALVEAAIPLEAMILSGTDTLHGPDFQAGVRHAIKIVRAALASKEPA